MHAVVREAKPRKILITGPNYRAVEELSGRLAENLDGDPKAVCDFFCLYSRTRDPKPVSASGQHLNLKMHHPPIVNVERTPSIFNMLFPITSALYPFVVHTPGLSIPLAKLPCTSRNIRLESHSF